MTALQTIMGNIHQLNGDETLRVPPTVNGIGRTYGSLRSTFATMLEGSRLTQIGYSFADQALAVGGGFLVNVALARVQTREEYGMFALSYSLFAFLSSLHIATIVEPYTVYGSGRYRERFSEYLRLIARSHALLGLLLSGVLLAVYLLLMGVAPRFAVRALLGLGLAVGFLLSGPLLRRVFYLQRQAGLAAKTSFVFFVTVALGLWLTAKAQVLDSLTVFLVLALGWFIAGTCFGRRLAFGKPEQRFLELEPNYWREHWKYSQWVLATALVFQLTNQGYYWILAGFVSAKEVGELKAMYNLIAPIEQVIISMSLVLLPAMATSYATKRMTDFLNYQKRYALAAVGVTGLFALTVRALGRDVMHVLYAGKFDGLAPLLYLLALLPVIMGIGITMGDALKASERPKLVFYGNLCSAAGTLLLGIPLVIHFGLRGAVYGMLVSGAIYTCTLAFALRACRRIATDGQPGFE